MNEASPFMTLPRAREIYWLHNNHRPMGELFDNGFLTKSRLEWGANNAYDPNIKEACKVLLKQKNLQLQKKIDKGKCPQNLDEARVVTWPFSQRTGKPGASIGQLLDSREISKQDLAYAIEKSRDDQVRSAAHIVLRNQLGLESEKMNESKGSLRVTSPKESYSENQSLWLAQKRGLVIGLLLGAMAIIITIDIYKMIHMEGWEHLWNLIVHTNGIAALLIALAIALIILIGNFILDNTIGKKVDNYSDQIKDYRQGKIGEDKVIDVFRESLDGSCHVFRNVILPNRKSDIDAVLVSPQGIYAFEIKNLNGKFENIGKDWFFKKGKKIKKAKPQPTIQALGNASALADFLEPDFARNKDKKWVTPIVALANADMICREEKPEVAIWRIEHLSEEIGNIPDKRAISEKTQQEICDRLMGLYK